MYNCFVINGSSRLKLHEADPNSIIKATGKIKQAVNSIDGFNFVMYPDNPCFNAITPMTSIIEVYKAADGERIFRGRVRKPTSAMDNSGLASRSYISEGELSYLRDSIQPYQTISGAYVIQRTILQIISTHNASMPEDKQFAVGTITTNLSPSSRTWHYVTSWKALADIIADYGGEIRLRYGQDGKRYIDYTSTVFEKDSDTKIELAINMQSVSFTVDPTNIASGVFAIGAKLHNDGSSAERLELDNVIWNNTLRQKYGDVVACVTWDDVTTKSYLQAKAEQWLADQSGELHQYSISAVDLSAIDHSFEEFEVGTQYAIVNPIIGLDDVIRCISKEIDINDPTATKMVFGDKYETLTTLSSARNNSLSAKVEKVSTELTEEQRNIAQSIVAHQTALMRGAEGGYRYDRLDSNGKPIETFYLNSPSIETATSALRINQHGIGFWTGTAGGAINGEYTSAWTIDGLFNTAYIVANTITGLKINNGNDTFKVEASGEVIAKALSIINGSINCGNGAFTVDSSGNVVANSLSSNNATITGGSIDIETSNENQDKITLEYNNYKITMAPFGLRVEYSPSNTAFVVAADGFKVFYNGTVVYKVDRAGSVDCGSIDSGSVDSSGDIEADGDIKAGEKVYGKDILLKLSDSASGYISLRDYINNHP